MSISTTVPSAASSASASVMMMTTMLAMLLLPAVATSSTTTSEAGIASAAAAGTGGTSNKWTPVRVSYDDLLRLGGDSNSSNNDKDDVWEALKTTGMLSVTSIPNFNKQAMLNDFESCVTAKSNRGVGGDATSSSSSSILSHTFEDGTVRQTIATRTVDGEADGLFMTTMKSVGRRDVADDEKDQEEDAVGGGGSGGECPCMKFQRSSSMFREQVQRVTDAVAHVIGRHYDNAIVDENGQMVARLQDSIDASKTYGVEEIIVDGEHLEHFHAYHSNPESASGDDRDEAHIGESDMMVSTIDWHTDQGIFLAFTPGQVNSAATEGLWVQLGDNQPPRHVDFDANVDDLAIMLGDGVYQYINPFLSENDQLTSVSHALKLGGMKKGCRHRENSSSQPDTTSASASASQPRVWYGRMVLPPPTAIHPRSPTKQTVAEVRMGMIQRDPEALQLGCSSSSAAAASSHDGHDNRHRSVLVARELTEPAMMTCNEETSSYCWHACMNYTDFDDISPEVCESRSLSLACVNPDGYLWTGKHDKEFGLGCVNLSIAENVTYPEEEQEATGEQSSSPPSAATTRPVRIMTSTSVTAAASFFGTVAVMIAAVW